MQRLARLSRLRPALSPVETAKHAARLRHGNLNARRGVSGASGGSGPEIIRLQRVRFVKPKRSLSRRLLPWTTLALILYIAGFISIEIEEEDEEEYEEEEEEEEGERENYAWFIPMPFTARLNQSPKYPPGPQRDAFEKIKRDPKLRREVTVKLSEMVYDLCCLDKPLVAELGKPRMWQRSSFRLSFPDRPAPQWSIWGIAITDDAIWWAQKQPVDSHMINMYHKLLWPALAAGALWTYTKTVTAQTFRYILGSPAQPPPHLNPHGALVGQNSGEKRAQVLFPYKPQLPGGPATGPPTADRSKDGNGHILPPESRQHGAEVANSNVQNDGADAGKGAVAPPRRSITYLNVPAASMRVPAAPMRDLFPTAWRQLMRDLRVIQRRKPRYPPPGCVRLSGWVTVQTNKYILWVDVVAFYIPEMGKFDGGSLVMTPRSAERIHSGG